VAEAVEAVVADEAVAAVATDDKDSPDNHMAETDVHLDKNAV
jgi:hypothetical protein